MRGKLNVHNKNVKTWAKSLSQKVINVTLGLLLVASPVIGIILPKTAHAATAGDVVVTEFIVNPVGTDTDREWVEIQNTTGSTIDLTGWDISGSLISGSLTLNAGAKAVVCVDSDTGANDGVVCDATSALGSGLLNTSDIVEIKDEVNNVIHSVSYASSDFSEGHSTNVASGLSIENTYRYSTNNYGTPANNTPLDDFDPVVTPTQPDVGPKYFNQHSSFKAIMTDEGLGNTGIATGTFRIWNGSGDTGLVNMGDGDNDDEYAGSTNTNLLPDGIYQIDFTATDNASNSTTSTVSNVVIDNTIPLADISLPVAGGTVSGTVAINGSGSDANMRGYRVRVYQAGNMLT